MNINELNSEIARKKIRACYLFSGEEDFQKESILKKIKEVCNEGRDWEDFNYNLFYGQQTKSKDIVACARTVPFMAQRRMIVVKNAEKFSADDEKKMVIYLTEPADFTCLVLLVNDSKKKFFKEIQTFVKHIVFKHPYENQISSWIKRETSKYGKTISQEACFYLKEEVGINLIDLHNEIEKLAIYVDDRREIVLEDVQSIVGHTREDNIFQLLNRLGEKKGKDTLIVMRNLVKKGEKPIAILIRIAKYMRQLIKAKLFLEKGKTNEEIRSSLRINNFYFKGFMEQLNNFSLQELKDNFRLLLLADKEIKTGKKEAFLSLEMLILKLTCQSLR